jgi:hypothetical protein
MLLDKGKITQEMIAMLSTWRHSGFHVFCGKRILPREETALKHLACYIIRASFSQERMRYLAQEGTVIYTAKTVRTGRSLQRKNGSLPCVGMFRTGESNLCRNL